MRKEIIMEIKTTPCYKFRDVKPEEQIAKLKEELAEVEEAYQRLKTKSVNIKIS